jgi:hypothetical protein
MSYMVEAGERGGGTAWVLARSVLSYETFARSAAATGSDHEFNQ